MIITAAQTSLFGEPPQVMLKPTLTRRIQVINGIAQPTNVMAKILYQMINGQRVSEIEIGKTSFRARLSELIRLHELDIKHEECTSKNEFGNHVCYRRHYLEKSEIEKAITVYSTINKK